MSNVIGSVDHAPHVGPTAEALQQWGTFTHLPSFSLMRYQLIRSLGHGTYGDVWLGRTDSGVDVAVKIPNPAFILNDGQISGHSIREIHTLLRTRAHPNVISLVGYDEAGHPALGLPFIPQVPPLFNPVPPRDPTLLFQRATANLQSELKAFFQSDPMRTLRRLTRRSGNDVATSQYSGVSREAQRDLLHPPPGVVAAACAWTARVCGFTRALASALAHCHAQSVLHRDVKAANILLMPHEGCIALTDADSSSSDGAPRDAQGPAHQQRQYLDASSSSSRPSRSGSLRAQGAELARPPRIPANAPLAVHPGSAAAPMAYRSLAGAAAAAARLCDFGLARSYLLPIPPYNAEVQSLWYRAPERLMGLPAGPAMDVWGVGCVLAECLTGWPIFRPTEAHRAVFEEVAKVCAADSAWASFCPFVGTYGGVTTPTGGAGHLTVENAEQAISVELVVGAGDGVGLLAGPVGAHRVATRPALAPLSQHGWLHGSTDAVLSHIPLLAAIPPSWRDALVALLRAILVPDPATRPSAADVAAHPALRPWDLSPSPLHAPPPALYVGERGLGSGAAVAAVDGHAAVRDTVCEHDASGLRAHAHALEEVANMEQQQQRSMHAVMQEHLHASAPPADDAMGAHVLHRAPRLAPAAASVPAPHGPTVPYSAAGAPMSVPYSPGPEQMQRSAQGDGDDPSHDGTDSDVDHQAAPSVEASAVYLSAQHRMNAPSASIMSSVAPTPPLTPTVSVDTIARDSRALTTTTQPSVGSLPAWTNAAQPLTTALPPGITPSAVISPPRKRSRQMP